MINVGTPKALTIAAGVSLCIGASFSNAESRRHGAHVHGVAELTIAQEGQVLEVQLTSPAMSIVGFETRAESAAQIEAVETAKASLMKGGGLFTIEGGACALSKVDVDVSGVMAEEHGHDDDEHHDDEHHGHEDDEHHDDEHHGHDDDEHHDDEHHGHDDDEHHHGHDDDDHDHEEVHSDIEAHYTFNCEDGAAEALTLGADKLPFVLETINAMWVSDQGQGSAVLSQESRRIDLR